MLRRFIWIWKILNRVNPMGKRRRRKKKRKMRERERESYCLHKEPIGCISPPWSPIQLLAHTAKQRAAGVNNILILVAISRARHYSIGCLGQTCVSLPEQLISDRQHITVRGYQPNFQQKENHCLSGSTFLMNSCIPAPSPRLPNHCTLIKEALNRLPFSTLSQCTSSK